MRNLKLFFIGIISFLFLIILSCTNNSSGLGPNNTNPFSGTVTDINGVVYRTVKIGTQEWMAENLRTTKYNDGTQIPIDTSTTTWANATSSKCCYYNNTFNLDSINKFGVLYNWYVVNPMNPKKIAPSGWHVPSDSEWIIMENFLISNGYNWDGTLTDNKLAKSLAAKTDWDNDTTVTPGSIGNNLSNNNKSDFSGLPSGARIFDGSFARIGNAGGWWSTTEGTGEYAYDRSLFHCYTNLIRSCMYTKSFGFSIRLVKD